MSLFTALWPSDEAIRHLAAGVDRVRARRDRMAEASAGLGGFRFVPPQRWHVTLCFHGDQVDQLEEERLRRRLDRRLPRLSTAEAPRLRLAGAGVFRGVLWVGVQPAAADDAAALQALVRAAGADPHGFRGHLTVARWGAGGPNRAALRSLFEGYEGPWWSVSEVQLVRSDLEAGQRVYRTVHRVELPGVSAGQQGETGRH
jgi:RNA 2',3'-cyclic 3'-phosphodiesterase